ncbi:MAG: DUF5317 domain-containing protein [Actinomycetota bacterium]|nr:DUF5317 domain-containing protein [Actinomycetota bacterium]MDQ3530167.1 DUF5317 domain-containing protein [Actinomycetota bacterium]
MILFVAFALAALSVPLAGGQLSALSQLRLRSTWLVLVALLVQVVVISVLADVLAAGLLAVVHVASYLLAVAFLVVNRRVPGMILTGSGGLLNLAAIMANAGVMPASPGALALAGRVDAHSFVNSGVVPDAHLAWLGDVFAIPEFLPLANVFSVGDLLLIVGVTAMLHRTCGSRLARHGREDRTGSRLAMPAHYRGSDDHRPEPAP